MISVIIPTFNRAWCVRGAVESVLAQRGVEVECILVDDGSTDGTREALEGLPIRYFHQENRGPAAARNRGIAEARGEYLAFLDSDDLWIRDKSAVQERYLREHPDLLLVHCNERWIRNGRHLNQGKRHVRGGGDQFERSLELCCISPSSVMVRRELFDRVGLFDEAASPCEDYDLWLRVTARFPVGFVPDELVIKRGGHEDQLTRRIPHLDYYRMKAIGKALASGVLNDVQAAAARRELEKKARIYMNGLAKRGRTDERKELESWLARIPEH